MCVCDLFAKRKSKQADRIKLTCHIIKSRRNLVMKYIQTHSRKVNLLRGNKCQLWRFNRQFISIQAYQISNIKIKIIAIPGTKMLKRICKRWTITSYRSNPQWFWILVMSLVYSYLNLSFGEYWGKQRFVLRPVSI